LNGDGVPFALIKCRVDHRLIYTPITRIGIDVTILNDMGAGLGNLKKLSTKREIIMNNVKYVKKKITPRRVRILLLRIESNFSRNLIILFFYIFTYIFLKNYIMTSR